MSTGFIGLNQASIAQALRLAAAGDAPLVWDHKTAQIGGTGAFARFASSPLDVVLASDTVVMTTVQDKHFSLADFGGLSDHIAGKVFIYQSDDSPREIAGWARELERAGAHFVEACFADSRFDDEITLLVGCTDLAWQAANEHVSKIATKIIRCGVPGDARTALLVDRSVTAACGLGTLEAIAAGRKMGLSLNSMLKVMNSGSGRNYMTRDILPGLVAGKNEIGLSFAQIVRDLDQAMTLAVQKGSPTLLTGVAHAAVQTAMNMLGGDRPFGELHRTVQAGAGVSILDSTAATKGKEIDTEVSEGTSQRVGYVGLGAMGAPLAGRLIAANTVTVYDPRSEQTEILKKDGASVASTLGEVAAESDVVFLCLPSTKIVREVLFGDGGLASRLRPGAIIIDQTTGDPLDAVEIARELAEKSISFIDAPVSGGPETASAGTSTIICGGDLEVFEKISPLLAQISPNITHCGPTGSGHAAKLVNNASNICNRLICYEAALLAHKAGLSLSVVDEVVNRSSGWSFASQRMFKSVQTHGHTATISLELTLKDIWSAVEIGMASGAPMSVANTARSLFQVGVLQFGADANVDEIVLLFERLAQTDFRMPQKSSTPVRMDWQHTIA